jgi:hypothetical protein
MASLSNIFEGKENAKETYIRSLDNLVVASTASSYALLVIIIVETLSTFISLLLEKGVKETLPYIIVEAVFFLMTIFYFLWNRWRIKKTGKAHKYSDYLCLVCIIGMIIPKISTFIILSYHQYAHVALGMSILIYFLILEKAIKELMLRIFFLFTVTVYCIVRTCLLDDFELTPLIQLVGVLVAGVYLVWSREKANQTLFAENFFLLEKERVWHKVIEDFPEWTFVINNQNQVIFSNNATDTKNLLLRIRTGMTFGKQSQLGSDPKLLPLKDVTELTFGGDPEIAYEFFMPIWTESTILPDDEKSTSRDFLSNDKITWVIL